MDSEEFLLASLPSNVTVLLDEEGVDEDVVDEDGVGENIEFSVTKRK